MTDPLRVLLIGATGQLGRDLQPELAGRGHEVIPLSHAELEVCDLAAVYRTLGMYRPNVVINTSAFHQVEEVERQPERAFAVNAVAPGGLARACRDHEAALAHVSTDYVFSCGLKPHAEEDAPEPVNVYGTSKLAGEYLIRSTLPQHYIVRTSGLCGAAGSSGKGGNFVETMLRLARERGYARVVNDQTLAPTYTIDLARKVADLIQSGQYGLYHVVNDGQCSWHDFAAAIFELANCTVTLEPTVTAPDSPVRRPTYSVLARTHLQRIGLDDMPHWRDALARYLAQRPSADRPEPVYS